jgi:choice-of-anchor B domain-containing protein
MRIILLTLTLLATIPAAFSQSSLNVNLLYHWEDPSLPSSSAWNNTYNEIWGVVVDNREYAIIGSTNGTHIFDVTDPANTVVVDFVPGAHQGPDIIHRDYDDYEGYLYAVSDEGLSTLQIMDLSYLPDSVSVVYESDELLVRSHNIFIDSANARLYACGVTNTSSQAHIEVYDISNPIAPVELASHDNLFYFHDCYVRDNLVFGHNGNDGMFVYDFTDAVNPTMEGWIINYPDRDYNHSGWADEEMEHYYLADENYGMALKVLDINDLTDINWVDTFSSELSSQSVAHNLIVNGDYLHVSYYHDGYYVFDISDRDNPVISGYYDTYSTPGYSSFEGNWGVYPFLPSGIVLASDMQSGLYVFDASAALGVDDAQQVANTELFHVTPNPFNERLSMRALRSSDEAYSVEMTDIQGKQVLRTEIKASSGQQVELQIPYDLGAGIYFLKISNDRYLQTAKISKIDQ